jgi:ribosomal protein S18 acetylase RimI-like enzyme
MLHDLLARLAPYSPTLIGTFPLGLQIEGSDLDIACSSEDLEELEAVLRSIPGVSVEHHPEAIVGRTEDRGLPIEIFGERQPVTSQNGFRHMIVEGRLLAVGGEALRNVIRAMKRAGSKTEPAFAELLGLEGDPYAALLALERWSTERLAAAVARALRPGAPPTIAPFAGDREALRPLFLLADDSALALAGYFQAGEVLVATAEVPVGHVQLIPTDAPDTWELKSLAVAPSHRATGLGWRLVEAACRSAREWGARRIILSTGAADTALLRFYQRAGFRLTHVDHDIFTETAGYPPGLAVDGIPLRDRVWFERTFTGG